MRFLFILFLLSTGHLCFAQKLTLDHIPLSWKDFNIKSPLPEGPRAELNIRIRYKMRPAIDDAHFLFESDVHIDAERSRADQSFLDHATANEKTALLNHAKGHVVLAYIYHKQLQQAMEQHHFNTNLSRDADSIIVLKDLELQTRRKAYDSATLYGTQQVIEKEWQRQLLQELNALYPEAQVATYATMALPKPESVWFDELPDYDYHKATLVFAENFDDNRNNWITAEDRDSNVSASITQGMLNIENNRANGNWSYNIKGNLDYSRDFEIRFSFLIRKSPGKYKGTGGFYWGDADTADRAGYAWVNLGRSELEMVNCHGGDHKSDQRKGKHIYPALKEGRWYKVVVRKVKGTYSVFLNDRLQVEQLYEPLPGNGLAFGAHRGSAMAYDYLQLYYLD